MPVDPHTEQTTVAGVPVPGAHDAAAAAADDAGATGLTRRSLLAWGLAAVPLGLCLRGSAAAQGFSQAPLVPTAAINDAKHSFWKELRNEFPIEPEHIHCDSAAIGTPSFQALESMQTALRQAAGIGSGLAPQWGDALRARLTSFVHAQPGTIFLAENDTLAMSSVADALPIPRGTRVILATHESPSTMAPWVSLAREGRLDIRMIEIGADPRTTFNSVRGQFETGSVLVIPHVLPTTGRIVPIRELSTLVHNRRGRIVVQGSQALGMLEVNVEELGVDAYVAATSTWLGGPQGVAFAYIHSELLTSLTPRPALIDVRTPEYVVQRRDEVSSVLDLETAPVNPGLAAGTVACVDWMAAFGVETARAYATILSRDLHAGLTGISGIEVLSSEVDVSNMPIVSFRVTRRPNTQVESWLLDEMGIRVHRLDNANLNAVRVSIGLRNQPSDIEWILRGAAALA